MELKIHDTGGDEHYSANDNVTYQGADVFMICVATDKITTFDNINAWRDRIMRIEPDKPIMLILTKYDLRSVVQDQDKVEY